MNKTESSKAMRERCARMMKSPEALAGVAVDATLSAFFRPSQRHKEWEPWREEQIRRQDGGLFQRNSTSPKEHLLRNGSRKSGDLDPKPRGEKVMKGHIRRRGENSFELKYEGGVDATGKRITKYASFKGTKREAQAKLAELITAVAKGSHVDTSKVNVTELVTQRIDQWEASGEITARTAARYRELLTNQITPFIGAMLVQKVRPMHVEQWHTDLRTKGRADGKGGLAPRTIGHAHRVLSSALNDAAVNELVVRNVMAGQSPPKVPDDEMVIVRAVAAFIAEIEASGRDLYVPAMVSLLTGMRRNEVLALRWGRVNLDKKVIQVREALEFTKAHGIRFKTPKSKAGRRDLTLPDVLVDVLRAHRKAQLELRLKLEPGSFRTMPYSLPILTVAPSPRMRSARHGAIMLSGSICLR